ncbi:MAG: hypothetical protein ABF649_04470 [Bacillus sp. (in: firmicutes)]
MRKVNGIKNLLIYLDSLGYAITKEEVMLLMKKREIPHQKPMRHLVIFDLDHIDWWVKEQRNKE